MRKSPLLLLGHLAAVAVAVVAVAGLVLALPAKSPRVVILNTACWSAAAWAYSDPAATNGIVADNACLLSQVLNFVWCKEYEGNRTPIFANYGNAGCLEAHVLSFQKAVTLPGVTAIVYINAPGGLGNFINADDTLALEQSLESIGKDYPDTKNDVAVYLDALRHSVGLASARAAHTEKDKPRRAFEPSPFSPDNARQARFENLLAQRDSLFGSLSLLPDRLIQLLDASAQRYLDPANDKPFRQSLAREDYWAAAGGAEVWQAFANIIARMCKARNITLVYYIPPHVHIGDDEYRTTFKPGFVDRVRQTFAAHDNVVVIDHANVRCVDPVECIWYYHKPGVPIKAGILYNAIGKLKQSRRLLHDLIDQDIIADSSHPPRYVGSAWPGERNLPPGNPTVRFVPERDRESVQEEILQPSCVKKSRRLLPGEEVPCPATTGTCPTGL